MVVVAALHLHSPLFHHLHLRHLHLASSLSSKTGCRYNLAVGVDGVETAAGVETGGVVTVVVVVAVAAAAAA